jgi:hypothetical protein
MEHKVRVVEPELWMQQLPQLLQQAQAVPLIISGNSMAPFLVHGRDTVYLSKLTRRPKKGDMILYRRDNGRYILHRIYRIRNGRYDLIGDGQLGIEPGICDRQILATVHAVRRKGKFLQRGNLCWEFFEHVWLALVPWRGWIMRLYAWLTPWRKRK